MKGAATAAAAMFAKAGTTWQERPVKPPPYAPSAKQITEVFTQLLAQVVDAKPHDVTGQSYDYAMSRGLRVRRLTKPDEREQRFVLEAQNNARGGPPGFNVLEIVDSAGNTAKWEPPPKPQVVTKAELQATVAELEAKLAAVSAKVDG